MMSEGFFEMKKNVYFIFLNYILYVYFYIIFLCNNEVFLFLDIFFLNF